MKKVRCSFCEKTVNAKIIKRWRKKIMLKDPCDGQLPGCGHLEGLYPVQYQQLVILNHKRGILNRHTCQGSGKKKTIHWTII